MFNIYDKIKQNPQFYRQLHCGDSLMTLFDCPLQNKFEDIWSHYNYVVYVTEGRKIWHTIYGTYDLQEGDCAFIRKGASIIEQFFEKKACFIIFFFPDEFICQALQHKSPMISESHRDFAPVFKIANSSPVHTFFQSVMSYFSDPEAPDQSLLELKFRELILVLAADRKNIEVIHYFSFLLKQPRILSLQQIMEENYRFNLKLEVFAKLSARSLSAFKRDFLKVYGATPGKWLLEKRLQYAHHLIAHQGTAVRNAAFESGFENPSHFSRAFRKRFGLTPASVKHQPAV